MYVILIRVHQIPCRNGFPWLVIFFLDNNVPIPSVFVIGGNGIPLGVVCFETTSEALHGSISNILEKHKPVEKVKEEGKIFKGEKMSVEVEERNLNVNNVGKLSCFLFDVFMK